MNRAVITVVLAGCSFSRAGGGSMPPAEVDAPSGGQQQADAPNETPRAPCATADATGLVACFELEDGVTDGILEDSGPGRRDAVTSGLSAATRGASGAAHVETGSSTRVPEAADLALHDGYTIAVWVRPDALPPVGGVYGLVDHELQYAMLVANGVTGLENRCVHTGVARAEYTEQLAPNTWSYLACTWDGVELCATRWTGADDHERYCHKPTLGPNASGSQGLAIGHLSDGGAAHSHFVGAIDSLQIYNRAMSSDELCTQLGQGAGCLPCDLCDP